jgi:hypothetical protein
MATGFVLLVILYLMYAPTFLTDYLMNSEWKRIGEPPVGFGTAMARSYLMYGRGLFGFYEELVYRFAGYNPAHIQFVRFVNFASIAGVALLLLWVFERDKSAGHLPFFTMLFWLSEPTFQGLMGYSLQLISNALPAMWLSLSAFYLHFFVFDDRKVPKAVQASVVFLLLLLAMQSTQTFAFIAVVPLAYVTLTDWRNQERRVWTFLLLCIVVFTFSTAAYKFSLDIQHAHGSYGYRHGEEGTQALVSTPLAVLGHALTPRTYWSAFKIWTFPFPLHNTSALSYTIQLRLAMTIMAAWLAIVAWSLFVEIHSGASRRDVFAKWLAVLVCLVFGAVFVIADSPLGVVQHRPHIILTLTGVVAVSGSYALKVLSGRYSLLTSRPIRFGAAAVVLMLALGAQAGVLRNIVYPHMRQLDFIRSEAIRQSPDGSYNDIMVVIPRRNDCLTEPCGRWMGRIVDGRLQLTARGAYDYAMSSIGFSPHNKQITFVERRPDQAPPGTIIIDWNDYSLTHFRYGESLHQTSPR